MLFTSKCDKNVREVFACLFLRAFCVEFEET